MKHTTTLCMVTSIVIGVALFVSAAQAQQFTKFEDDGSAQTFAGTGVHVCAGGAMFGVDAANNRFLCVSLTNLGTPAVDRDTHATFFYKGQSHEVHICPSDTVMVGWHRGNNWLICAPNSLFNTGDFSDTGTSAVEPNHPDRSMHVCDDANTHTVMVGIHEGDNVLICRSDVLPPTPFNLIIDTRDGAGFPLNPRWQANLAWKDSSTRFVPDARYCLDHPFSDSLCVRSGTCSDLRCTTDTIEFNLKGSTGFGGPSGAFCEPNNLGGHVNWQAATYTGTLFWEGFSGSRPFEGDADYNFQLQTNEGAGVDKGNWDITDPKAKYGALGIEFASYETIDHFTTSWWRSFKNAVDHDNKHARGMVQGLQAIATGTLGLDCEYVDCHAELHPVFALAMETKADLADNTWAFFVRNNGNEGSCSSHPETVSTSEFDFDIPWKAGATSVVAATQAFKQLPTSSTAQLMVTPLPCENKVRVQITGAPLVGTTNWMGDGELHLSWTPGVPSCSPEVYGPLLKWLTW